MTDAMTDTPSACPACAATPMARRQAAAAQGAEQAGRLMLSLPEIRCAGCITGVEKALSAEPGVRSARVNFTLKRATVETDPGVRAADLVAALDRAGHVAHE